MMTLRMCLVSPYGLRCTSQSTQHQSQQHPRRHEAFDVPNIYNIQLFAPSAVSKLPVEDGSSANRKAIAHFRVLMKP